MATEPDGSRRRELRHHAGPGPGRHGGHRGHELPPARVRGRSGELLLPYTAHRQHLHHGARGDLGPAAGARRGRCDDSDTERSWLDYRGVAGALFRGSARGRQWKRCGDREPRIRAARARRRRGRLASRDRGLQRRGLIIRRWRGGPWRGRQRRARSHGPRDRHGGVRPCTPRGRQALPAERLDSDRWRGLGPHVQVPDRGPRVSEHGGPALHHPLAGGRR